MGNEHLPSLRPKQPGIPRGQPGCSLNCTAPGGDYISMMLLRQSGQKENLTAAFTRKSRSFGESFIVFHSGTRSPAEKANPPPRFRDRSRLRKNSQQAGIGVFAAGYGGGVMAFRGAACERKGQDGACACKVNNYRNPLPARRSAALFRFRVPGRASGASARPGHNRDLRGLGQEKLVLPEHLRP